MKVTNAILILILTLISCSHFSGRKIGSISQMENWNFQVDRDYLTLYTLWKGKNLKNPEFLKDLVNYQNRVWDLYNDDYQYLKTFRDINPEIINSPENKRLKIFSEKAQMVEGFEKIFNQTEEFKNYVQKRWEKNFDRSLGIMEDITGLNFDKKLTILITAPGMPNGTHRKNMNLILWGGKRDDFPNYDTIYIWHETLHFYLGREDKSHVLITLATDNELRFRLNETNVDYSIGHEWLNNYQKEILPLWKDFMGKSPRNILELEKKILDE